MLEAQAVEEAAKVLVLLDLVRLGWRDPLKVKVQIARFYDHLSRCIYAEVSKMRPADLAEVCRMVEDMRQAYYLDGPNDVNWIFRNQLLSSREDGLYVDYVRYEDRAAWSTPAGRDVLGFGPDTAVQRLVSALHRLGVTSRRGLEVLADGWAGQVIEDATPWPVVANLNAQVLAQLDNDVPKLDRLARSVPDARQIGDSLAARGVRLSPGGTVYDPADPMGKMFFKAHLVALGEDGEHTIAELAELFSMGRSTVYRAIERARIRTAEGKKAAA